MCTFEEAPDCNKKALSLNEVIDLVTDPHPSGFEEHAFGHITSCLACSMACNNDGQIETGGNGVARPGRERIGLQTSNGQMNDCIMIKNDIIIFLYD